MIGVCLTAYNHAAYIGQAIESVLAQVCDEEIRLYIGDDASCDATERICSQYAERDERIRYTRRVHNIGVVENTLLLYEQIRRDGGEYIAMLDGDDYWTDEKKLQIQIDYLRQHPDYGFVHTAAYDEIDGRLIKVAGSEVPTGDISLRYGREGAITTNCTVVFRTALLDGIDFAALRQQRFLVLDYPLYGLFAQHTLFGYIDRFTAAWRNHESVSQPKKWAAYRRYQYHYLRAWKWLELQYPGHFHYRWYKAILRYVWQNFYFLFAQMKKKL